MLRSQVYALLAIGLLLVTSGSVAAQQNTEALRRAVGGQGVTQTEILQRLRNSGLSRSEIKQRLVEAGYDPSLVDTYMDMLDGGRSTRPLSAPEDFLSALEEIGITSEGVPVQSDTTVGVAGRRGSPYPGGYAGAAGAYPGTGLDPAANGPAARPPRPDTVRVNGLRVFGRALFLSRPTDSQFEPAMSGPVPPDYRVGPGDELVLIVTGAVQTAYTMEVMRDGAIVIPDVGTVGVNGLTLSQVESLLYDRLQQVYSGVGRGAEATTHLSLSVGRLRNVRVVVAGDVEEPGAYVVPSLGTAFTALYRAGGPNAIGSFRRIQVRRGGRLVRTLDLYDYLVDGDGSSDVRVEQGDFIFVPVAGARVTIDGAARRPGAYELLGDEGLRHLLRFAGGIQADAVARRVQIDRILPPSQRTPGVDRVLVDVNLEQLFDSARTEIPLVDGDRVQIFTVAQSRRHRVAITGAVHRPGSYEWTPGMTLRSLVGNADGLAEHALLSRAHIYRLDTATGQRELIPAHLAAIGGAGVAEVPLLDRDSVVVLSRAELATADSIEVDGYVKHPGKYLLARGTTVRDAILRAGGFAVGAEEREAEVARMPAFTTRSDTVARVFQVHLGSETAWGAHGEDGAVIGSDGRSGMATGSNGRNGVASGSDGAEAADLPAADEFLLEHGDRVFVRKAPGYEPLRTVAVTGEVITPSEYVLDSRTAKVTDVIRRAGGLTPEASIRGVQLIRRGDLVAVDLERAEETPGSRYDFVLEPGDSLFVPKYDPTVLVTGKGVAFSTRVPFRPGAGLDYYIGQAGGYTDAADRDRLSITYQNGQRAISSRFLLFHRAPQPRAGSTVLVPEVPASELNGVDMVRIATTAVGLLSSTATLLVLIQQLH